MDIEKLKYPIGRYKPGEVNPEVIKGWIDELRTFPDRLIKVLEGIDDESLKYTYRPGGWNIQQLVHHLADSHMNSITRFKWTLTEYHPMIKPYLEAEWAKLYDVQAVPVEASVDILKGVHLRLSTLLQSMKEDEFDRTLVHPEHGKVMDLTYLTGMYAWHCNHHLAHIQAALKFKKVDWE
ncbi:MAG: YfiT family bacillithiol transferase [Bacteroidota bacterium]